MVTSTPLAPSSTSRPPPSGDQGATAGAIAGGVIGALACLAILGILCWHYLYRPRHRPPPIDLFGSNDRIVAPSGINEKLVPISPNASYTIHPVVHGATVTSSPVQPITPASKIVDATPGFGTRMSPDRRGPLQVANPEPQVESQHTAHFMLQPELQERPFMLKGEAAEFTIPLPSPTYSHDAVHRPQPVWDFNYSPGSNFHRQSTSVTEIRAQIQVLHEQLAFMQAQKTPPCGLGESSSEPPPDYSPASGGKALPSLPKEKRKSQHVA